MKCENNCNNGYIKKFNEELGCEEYVLCACKREALDNKIFRIKLDDSGIPKYYWDKDLNFYSKALASIPANQQRTVLLNFIKEPHKFYSLGSNLWVYGKNSAEYKTSLVIELGKQVLMNRDVGYVKFIPFRKLMDLFLDFEVKRNVISTIMSAKVIIIDDMFDLTRSSVKEYQAVNLYGFIEDIMNNNIKILCTSKNTVNSYMDSALFKETAKLISYASPMSLNLEIK